MQELGHSLGDYIAELRIIEDGVVRFERTLGRGHYTLLGEPGAMLKYVVAVQTV
jgi:hypothetical protein